MELTSRFADYWWITVFTLAIGGICDLLSPFIDYQVISLIFLLSIVCFSLFVSRGPLLFSAILFSFVWGFFFIHSLGAVSLAILFSSYFVTAFILSILTERIGTRERLLRRHEEKTMIVYEIVRKIATTPFSKDLFLSICTHLNDLLGGKSEILLKEIDNGLIIDSDTTLLQDEKEKAVAKWVFEMEKWQDVQQILSHLLKIFTSH